MAYTTNKPWNYNGTLAARGTTGTGLSGPLADYQKVNFVLPTNTTKNLSGMGQLPQLSPVAWIGVGLAGLAAWWFGVHKKARAA